jgi:chromosomal replication initiation ATPase DnaA
MIAQHNTIQYNASQDHYERLCRYARENDMTLQEAMQIIVECVVGGQERHQSEEMSKHELAGYVCAAFDVTPTQLFSAKRSRHICEAREGFVYLGRTQFKWTYKEIGEFLNRDHTTAMNSFNNAEDYIDTRQQFFTKRIVAIQRKIDLATANPNSPSSS